MFLFCSYCVSVLSMLFLFCLDYFSIVCSFLPMACLYYASVMFLCCPFCVSILSMLSLSCLYSAIILLLFCLHYVSNIFLKNISSIMSLLCCYFVYAVSIMYLSCHWSVSILSRSCLYCFYFVYAVSIMYFVCQHPVSFMCILYLDDVSIIFYVVSIAFLFCLCCHESAFILPCLCLHYVYMMSLFCF